MASDLPSTPSMPDDSAQPVNNLMSSNAEDTSQSPQNSGHGKMAGFRARLKAFKAPGQGATTNPLAQHGGSMPTGSVNVGGRLNPPLPRSTVDDQDKHTPTNDESSNPRDIALQPSSLSEPRGGNQKDKAREATDGGNQISRN